MAQLKIQALPLGAKIGVYEIKEIISSDWSGNLYRAWNAHLNATAVLKEYLPSDYAIKAKFSKETSDYEYGIKKFIELAESLEEVHQNNVVKVHNILYVNKTSYLVMEFVEGGRLSEIQKTFHSFADVETEQILKSLLNALQATHDENIIHGAITPSNIIIKENGEPVLINFASADIALSYRIKQTQEAGFSEFNDTNNYHSKEQLSISSDIYSLGASMFFCLTGNDPASISSRQMALSKNKADPCYLSLKKVGNTLNEGLLKTVFWMLDPNPEQRPQSAGEVLIKLDSDAVKNKVQKGGLHKFYTKKSIINVMALGSIGTFVVMLSLYGLYSQQKSKTELRDLQTGINQAIEKKKAIISASTEQLLEKPSIATESENKQVIEANSRERNTFTEKDKVENKYIGVQKDGATWLTKRQVKKINKYLVAAENNIDKLNLTTPADNNAFDQYQAILEIDPKNKQAKKGLQNLSDIYTEVIVKALKRSRFNEASLYMRRLKALKLNTPLNW